MLTWIDLSESLEACRFKSFNYSLALLIENLEPSIDNLRNEPMLVCEFVKGLRKPLDHVGFAVLIHFITILEEFLKNLNLVGITTDFVVAIK